MVVYRILFFVIVERVLIFCWKFLLVEGYYEFLKVVFNFLLYGFFNMIISKRENFFDKLGVIILYEVIVYIFFFFIVFCWLEVSFRVCLFLEEGYIRL